MSTEIKDFIKFVAGVLVILMIFIVIFTPEGIASNTFNYMTYAEPILLQDWLSTAITVGSNSPGEFITSIRTSGNPYTISIYKRDNTPYINILLPQEEFLKTKFAKVEPVPVITDCEISDQTIELKKNLVQTITVRKFIKDSSCVITVNIFGVAPEVMQPPPPPPPPSCDCTDWESIGPCGESPCEPDEVKYVRFCDPSGCDPGDGMGESQCIFDASCPLGFDFSISVDPDSGAVNRDLSIDTNVSVDVVSGVRELVNLSASGLPSDTTLSFEYQNFTPPATSKTTITTTGLTPKGTFIIMITGESDGLTRTADYDLTVVEPGGCCPHILLSAPASIDKGDIFTVNLTYTHDIPSGGGVHLHWPFDKASFISLESSVSGTIYLPNAWDSVIMNGNDLVECGNDTNRMYNGDTCNITLQALDGDIDLFYRAWDWSNDAVCGEGRVNAYDYDRDPNSGTCSLDCDVFPDQVILCETYTQIVNVFDFSLDVVDTSGSVILGDSISTTIDLNSLSAITELVTLSVSGLPPDATASFTPSNTCDPTCSLTLTISTQSTTPPGTYIITVTGTDGGLTRTDTYTLIVTPPLIEEHPIYYEDVIGSVQEPQNAYDNGFNDTSTRSFLWAASLFPPSLPSYSTTEVTYVWDFPDGTNSGILFYTWSVYINFDEMEGGWGNDTIYFWDWNTDNWDLKTSVDYDRSLRTLSLVIGSDYFNSTGGVKVKFEANNTLISGRFGETWLKVFDTYISGFS